MRRARLTVACISLCICACTNDEPSPAVLRVSAIPDQTPQNVREQHVPIMESVCRAAGLACEWVPIATYDGVVDALGNGRIDMAFLGSVTYASAQARHGVVPLAIRDVDTRFSVTLVVRTGSSARELRDLKGATFLFGNRQSSTGHVMARHFLALEGITPETFFARVEHADHHDQTLARVASGGADAGVVNSAIALRALGSGGAYEGALRVLWESPSYVDYVWSARRDLPQSVRRRLTEGFLDMNLHRADHASALQAQGANGFLPALAEEYEAVPKAMRAAGVW